MWFQATLETSYRAVANELCQIAMHFRERAPRLDAEAANAFQTNTYARLPGQVVDLRVIAASFKKRLADNLVDLNDSVLQQFIQRVKSFDDFLDENEDANRKLPGLRLFSPIPSSFQS
jgi:hypothetical protein